VGDAEIALYPDSSGFLGGWNSVEAATASM